MNTQQRNQMYPRESYNNKDLCEQRWEADTQGYYMQEWQISIGNGKRLRRKWTRKGGIAYVPNRFGEIQTVYNQTVIDAFKEAEFDRECKPPKGLTRQVAMDYDRSFQPDGDDDFYNNLQH